jgi:hypothetical protein
MCVYIHIYIRVFCIVFTSIIRDGNTVQVVRWRAVFRESASWRRQRCRRLTDGHLSRLFSPLSSILVFRALARFFLPLSISRLAADSSDISPPRRIWAQEGRSSRVLRLYRRRLAFATGGSDVLLTFWHSFQGRNSAIVHCYCLLSSAKSVSLASASNPVLLPGGKKRRHNNNPLLLLYLCSLIRSIHIRSGGRRGGRRGGSMLFCSVFLWRCGKCNLSFGFFTELLLRFLLQLLRRVFWRCGVHDRRIFILFPWAPLFMKCL